MLYIQYSWWGITCTSCESPRLALVLCGLGLDRDLLRVGEDRQRQRQYLIASASPFAPAFGRVDVALRWDLRREAKASLYLNGEGNDRQGDSNRRSPLGMTNKG
jgi:hypothetical protein